MVSIKLQPFTLQIEGVDELRVKSLGGTPQKATVVINEQGDTAEIMTQQIYYELVRHHAVMGEKVAELGTKDIPTGIWRMIENIIMEGPELSEATRTTLNAFFEQAGWPEIVVAMPEANQ
jgi:hypothetical protein